MKTYQSKTWVKIEIIAEIQATSKQDALERINEAQVVLSPCYSGGRVCDGCDVIELISESEPESLRIEFEDEFEEPYFEDAQEIEKGKS